MNAEKKKQLEAKLRLLFEQHNSGSSKIPGPKNTTGTVQVIRRRKGQAGKHIIRYKERSYAT